MVEKIKGWRKVKTYNPNLVSRWIREESRFIGRIEDVSVSKYPDGYDVWHSTNPVSFHKKVYHTKSKQRALNYAKQYMRSNPNG